jgi:hypothetical protein
MLQYSMTSAQQLRQAVALAHLGLDWYGGASIAHLPVGI